MINVIEQGENLIGFLKLNGVHTISDSRAIDEVKNLVSSAVSDFNSDPFKFVSTHNKYAVEMIDVNCFLMINSAKIIPIYKDDELIIACTMKEKIICYCYLEYKEPEFKKQLITAEDACKYEKLYLLMI